MVIKMRIQKIIRGGWLADSRTHVMSVVGVLSALAAYLVGDNDIFVLCQALFTLGGIYFIRKSNNQNKGN